MKCDLYSVNKHWFSSSLPCRLSPFPSLNQAAALPPISYSLYCVKSVNRKGLWMTTDIEKEDAFRDPFLKERSVMDPVHGCTKTQTCGIITWPTYLCLGAPIHQIHNRKRPSLISFLFPPRIINKHHHHKTWYTRAWSSCWRASQTWFSNSRSPDMAVLLARKVDKILRLNTIT